MTSNEESEQKFEYFKTLFEISYDKNKEEELKKELKNIEEKKFFLESYKTETSSEKKLQLIKNYQNKQIIKIFNKIFYYRRLNDFKKELEIYQNLSEPKNFYFQFNEMCGKKQLGLIEEIPEEYFNFKNPKNSYDLLGMNSAFLKKGEIEKSYILCSEAADQGNPIAHFNLGVKYQHGEKKDYQKALHHYQTALDEGFLPAALNIGDLYFLGFLGEKNETKAKEYYEFSLNSGYELAYGYLAWFYENSENFKDQIKAIYYLKLSADLGFVESQYLLGEKYKYGSIVNTDLKLARYYLELSASKGYENAKKLLKYL